MSLLRNAIIPPPTITRKDVAPTFLKLPPDPADLKAFKQTSSVPLALVPELVDRLPYEDEPKPIFKPKLIHIDPTKEKRVDTSTLKEDQIKDLVEVGFYPDGRPIHLMLPAFAGLRARVAERRARRTQARLEGLAYDQKVRHYLGERVIKGKPYLPYSSKAYPAEIERPYRSMERATAARLDSIHRRKGRVKQAAYHQTVGYPEIVGKKRAYRPFRPLFRPLYDEYDKGPGDRLKRSAGERLALGRAARKYRTNQRMARVYDRLFRHVITEPSRLAKGLPERRDNSAVRAEALRHQAEVNKQARQARRAAAANKIKSVKTSTGAKAKKIASKLHG